MILYDINILILEEDVSTATNLQERFNFWGYKTPIISSSKEALKIAENIKPHLALIEMELDNREEVIDIARKLSNDFDTAVLYIISFLSEENMDFIRPKNLYGVILKPFEENQMKYKVEEVIYTQKIFKSLIASK